jgi:cell division protein FtsX
MSDVKGFVQKAVDQINEQAQKKVEDRAQTLVSAILSSEAQIKKLQVDIGKFKTELSELRLPDPVTVEV